MKRQVDIMIICAAFFLIAAVGKSEYKADTNGETVEAQFPGLASGALTFAKPGELPGDVLLRADTIEITSADLEKIIASKPGLSREQKKANAFFFLEQEAKDRLLRRLAGGAPDQGTAKAGEKSDREAIRAYLDRVAGAVDSTDDDVTRFYNENKDTFCGAKLEQVRPQVRQYLMQEKKQEAVSEHLRNLGRKMSIVVSRSWVKEQAALARENPVDKTRGGGKPSLVVFSAASCCGPDKMRPVLDALKKTCPEKMDIVYVEARKENILATRYNVSSIPTQIFFDAAGKEILRHRGFMSQDSILTAWKQRGINLAAEQAK
ncbi:MAG: thioredoxin family protein [Candidatus Aureabacteria bacterium]|nr:thioredoxin family protein [Candidatus Auribacterota bacterium]